ncbi:MAG: DUF3795 domain-containing protein [Candidatus Hecatellaceae archaeon]
MFKVSHGGNPTIKGRDLVGCCGIYCGACFAYRRSLSSEAGKLKELLEKEKFDRIATAFSWVGSYRDFKRWLTWLKRLTCNGCQTGGGNPFCAIRRCCQRKGLLSCADCPEMPCRKLDWITRRYRKWNLKNLERIREAGYQRWLREMRAEVRKGFTTGKVIAGISRKRKG